MQDIINEITRVVATYIPSLLGALAILILGWLVALVISSIVKRVLHRTSLDNKMAQWIGGEERAKTIEVEKGISKGVYYLIMLFVLVAFFQTLGITLITEPLNRLLTELLQFAPKLIGAGILLLIAVVIASLLRLVVSKILSVIKIDERLSKQAGVEEKQMPLTKTLSNALYWLVFLLFLPAVLSTLGVEGLLRPVQGMLNKILDFLPNIIMAVLILIGGWFVARIVQRIVSNLLASIGTDQLSERVGLAGVLGKQRLSNLVGVIVYVLILIPVLIAALNTLALEAITRPATNMLNIILGALPNIFAAVLVLTIAYIVGQIVSNLVSNLLTGAGFNNILLRIGLSKEPSEGKWAPASIVGFLVLLTIMFFAIIEASNFLGFRELANMMTQFMVFAGHITLGLIIFAIGLYLSGLASKSILATGTTQAWILSMTSRIAIILLAGAMALRQMGLANEIITLAFGLLLGAVAVAVAIAFGIGGREMASRKLEEWFRSIKSKESKG